MEVPVVICSHVRDAAGGDVEKMPCEVEHILGDILHGVVPCKELFSDVLQNVLEVCSESGHVYSTHCHIKRDICQLGWNVESNIVQCLPSALHGCHV